MQLVHGVVQHYEWGDPSFIPRLLHIEPDGRPYAELWFGTHAGGPATTDGDVPLQHTTGELPYLLKVLAAAEPLSLQTHPTRRQAEQGFAREEHAGPVVDARTRVYRDPQPKPELLCALTSFDTLCGFRPVAATLELLRRLGIDELAALLSSDGLPATVNALYNGDVDLNPVDRSVPVARRAGGTTGRRAGAAVSRRPECGRDAAVEPHHACPGRGDLPGPRQPARVPAGCRSSRSWAPATTWCAAV